MKTIIPGIILCLACAVGTGEVETKPQPIPVPGDGIPRKLPPQQITLSCEVVALDSVAKTLDVKLGEKEQRVVLLDQLDVKKDNRAVPVTDLRPGDSLSSGRDESALHSPCSRKSSLGRMENRCAPPNCMFAEV